MDKKTPIYDSHIRLGGKMVPFAGYQMPVQYPMGIKGEHNHVRSKIGLFDVSHMGEFRVRGPKALETLQWVTTNDVSKLTKGKAQYTLLANAQGGVVDDLIIYCIEPNEDYLLCVNAANIEKDFQYIQDNNRGADLANQSEQWGLIAIQGPMALGMIKKFTGVDVESQGSFTIADWDYKGEACIIARTGYTGEDGVEIFVPQAQAQALWDELLAQGDEVQPIGLGARDTLRMEMKFPLYGHELSDETNPYEAGLGWVVKPDAKDFIGKEPMLAKKQAGLSQKLIGLEITGRGIARDGYKVFSFDNREIGKVTSGTLSPSINKAIAIAYVDADHANVGDKLQVEIRNKQVEAVVVKTPFYKK